MANLKQKAKELRRGFEGILPVPVNEIAKRKGITIKYGALEEDMSGFLFTRTGQTVIGINAFHSPTRQNFTIAHELGHFVLKHHGEFFVDRKGRMINRDYKSGLGIDPIEREANAFAAELLMPEEDLVEILTDRNLDVEDEDEIQEIAEKFGVSRQAMTYRIANLFAQK